MRIALLVFAALAASSVLAQIKTPEAFEADVIVTNNMIPIPVKAHMYFDEVAQMQRLDQRVFGQTLVEIDRYDQSLKYVFGEMFGQTMCQTCYLKPPLYPLYVPPGSVLLRNESLNGYNCGVYGNQLMPGLNATFWVTPQYNQNLMVQADFLMLGQFDTKMSFSNIKPGPQNPSLFDPPQNCAPPVCAGNANVGVLIDGSGSITDSDFSLDRQFTVNLINGFELSSSAANIAVVQFASTTSTVSALTGDKNALIAAVNNMGQLRTGTNTAAGINAIAGMLTGREAEAKIMIIITDGQSNEGSDPIQAAATAKSQGIEVFCVGVGSGIDMNQLNGMASEPTQLHVLTASDYSSLQSILTALVSTTCPAYQCTLNNNGEEIFRSAFPAFKKTKKIDH